MEMLEQKCAELKREFLKLNDGDADVALSAACQKIFEMSDLVEFYRASSSSGFHRVKSIVSRDN